MEYLSYQLCYVKDNWAYFTSIPLYLQWGDDWSEVPYEHNSGPPYNSFKINEDFIEHNIIKIAWECQLDTPCSGKINSSFSVENINSGNAPWLSNRFWIPREDLLDEIYAGATLKEFIDFIHRNNGEVYFNIKNFKNES